MKRSGYFFILTFTMSFLLTSTAVYAQSKSTLAQQEMKPTSATNGEVHMRKKAFAFGRSTKYASVKPYASPTEHPGEKLHKQRKQKHHLSRESRTFRKHGGFVQHGHSAKSRARNHKRHVMALLEGKR